MKKNYFREKILNLLKSPMGVTQLKANLPEISSLGTLAYHLKVLKKEGLIKSRKEEKKQGRPTKYSLK